MAAVRAGLPTTALERLQSHLQVSDARLALILGMSPRTLRRRREAGMLTTDESDRLPLQVHDQRRSLNACHLSKRS